MSMISSLIDELRKAAQTCRDLGRYETEQMLLDAADTIWQLRDDLQRANAENVRMRSELESVGTAAYLYGHGNLKAENTKLRELVCWMYDRMDESCAVQYPYAPTPISYDRLMQALARARELGIEIEE